MDSNNLLGPAEIYVSGYCDADPGPGGFAAVLFDGEASEELQGFEIWTTSEDMALQAIKGGLRRLAPGRDAVVFLRDDRVFELVSGKTCAAPHPSARQAELLRAISLLSEGRQIEWELSYAPFDPMESGDAEGTAVTMCLLADDAADDLDVRAMNSMPS